MSNLKPRRGLVGLGLVLLACQGGTGPNAPLDLVSAGWSFGECLGLCVGELSVMGPEVTYQISSNNLGGVQLDNRGDLTPAGASQLISLAQGLPSGLRDRYGCPDCADGGASHLTLEEGANTMRIDYEFGQPPAVLASLDAFLSDVMLALESCVGTESVSLRDGCVPL